MGDRNPPNVPEKQFWAVTVYDLETPAFIQKVAKRRNELLSKSAEERRRIGGCFFGPKALAGGRSLTGFTRSPGSRGSRSSVSAARTRRSSTVSVTATARLIRARVFKIVKCETQVRDKIGVPTHFRDFYDYWSPVLAGQDPGPEVVYMTVPQPDHLKKGIQLTD